MNKEYLKDAHRHSFQNAKELEYSKLCGCFYCLKIYSSKIINEYTEDKTAVCPYCGVDSVIGDSSGIPISKSFYMI